MKIVYKINVSAIVSLRKPIPGDEFNHTKRHCEQVNDPLTLRTKL